MMQMLQLTIMTPLLWKYYKNCLVLSLNHMNILESCFLNKNTLLNCSLSFILIFLFIHRITKLFPETCNKTASEMPRCTPQTSEIVVNTMRYRRNEKVQRSGDFHSKRCQLCESPNNVSRE